ncbi:MAG: 30S ribosomal protein S9 [Desulfosalsimonadaceae bacterium]
MERENVYYATGRRKTAVARTWLKPGSGEIVINNKSMDDYFRLEAARRVAKQALDLTNTTGAYDVKVNVRGGGTLGQAEAVRHGITRTLFRMNPEFRQILKKAGFVKRDPRKKERKKYGQPGARARFQFSKR